MKSETKFKLGPRVMTQIENPQSFLMISPILTKHKADTLFALSGETGERCEPNEHLFPCSPFSPFASTLFTFCTQVKQEKGASPPSSSLATGAAAASHPMAAEALAAQANFEVNFVLILN